MTTLINKIKYNKFLYLCYYYLGNIAISIIKVFIKPQDNLVLFVSFGGRRYDDSPKAIYNGLIKDSRFDEYELVWAFLSPEKYTLPRGQKIRIDTYTYFKFLLKARVWVTNTTMTRALNFEGINTFSLNTWHGSAIKKIGRDAVGNNVFVSKGSRTANVFLGQGKYDKTVFSRAFGIPQDRIKLTGLPRNDELAKEDVLARARLIKEKLSIPMEKKVILYAPTFREYEREGSDCIMNLPISWEKWESVLGKRYVLLVRAHHAVVKKMDIKDNALIKDVSSYPQLNDLMIVSDILISDYSSIFFDYSIQGKPMFCFAYDFEKYQKERGMYFDIRKELDNDSLDTEDKLLSAILEMNEVERIAVTKRFRDKYVQKYGTATRDTLDLIYQAIHEG